MEVSPYNDETNPLKYCPACKTTHHFSEFGSNRSRHDGLAAYCRKAYSAKNAANARHHRAIKRAEREALAKDTGNTRTREHRHRTAPTSPVLSVPALLADLPALLATDCTVDL